MNLVMVTRILSLIKDNPGCGYALLCGEFEWERRTARQKVQELVDSGEVSRKEGGPKGATLWVREQGMTNNKITDRILNVLTSDPMHFKTIADLLDLNPSTVSASMPYLVINGTAIQTGDGLYVSRPKCYRAVMSKPWTKDIDLEAA